MAIFFSIYESGIWQRFVGDVFGVDRFFLTLAKFIIPSLGEGQKLIRCLVEPASGKAIGVAGHACIRGFFIRDRREPRGWMAWGIAARVWPDKRMVGPM